jgi:hypothetical protein
LKEIYIYFEPKSWLNEQPEATIHGRVTEKSDKYIQIEDDNGLTQLIILDKVFAIVY